MRKLLLAAAAALALGSAVAYADSTPNDGDDASPPADSTETTPLNLRDLQPIAEMKSPAGLVTMNVVPRFRHDFDATTKGLVVVALDGKKHGGMAIIAKFDCRQHLFGFLGMYTVAVTPSGDINPAEKMPLTEQLVAMTPTSASPWGGVAEKVACNAHYQIPKFQPGEQT